MCVPLGQYDDTRLVNVGTNRWSVKPELGISKALGRWTLELAPAVTFYSENDDFLRGKTREQAPLYSVQANASDTFARGFGWREMPAISRAAAAQLMV